MISLPGMGREGCDSAMSGMLSESATTATWEKMDSTHSKISNIIKCTDTKRSIRDITQTAEVHHAYQSQNCKLSTPAKCVVVKISVKVYIRK